MANQLPDWRTLPVTRGHGPVSKACRAADTAAFTSAGCAVTTVAIVSTMQGFTAYIVSPPCALSSLL
jgi:hypothetical protein